MNETKEEALAAGKKIHWKQATNLKEMVKDKTVHFKFCRSTSLFYETEDGFLFEVPITDIGTGVMNRDDKAILYMRWIRKQMEANEAARQECKG